MISVSRAKETVTRTLSRCISIYGKQQLKPITHSTKAAEASITTYRKRTVWARVKLWANQVTSSQVQTIGFGETMFSPNKKLLGITAENDFQCMLCCTAYHLSDLYVEFIQKACMCCVKFRLFCFILLFGSTEWLFHGKELLVFLLTLYLWAGFFFWLWVVFWCLVNTHQWAHHGPRVPVQEGPRGHSWLLLDLTPPQGKI